MAAGALTLGVAHPPGYPLYLLISHLWLKLLPLGSVAFRLNVLSAAAGAAACCVLAVVLRRAGARSEDPIPLDAGAAAAFLLLALAPAFWHLSLVSEMYSINALVALVILLLMLPGGDSVRRPPAASGGGASSPDGSVAHRKRIYAGALLFGLGLGNHQTLAAALPGYLWIARRELFGGAGFSGRRFWRERLPGLLFFSLAGFALYAYLPLRSAQDPVLDWGEPETLRTFWRMLTRADLGGIRLHPEQPFGLTEPGQWWAGSLYTGRLMLDEFGWAGALLFLWGAWSGRRSSFIQGCLAAFAASGPLFIVWANLDPALAQTYAILEPHLVLPLAFAAAVAGWGARDLFARAAERRPYPAAGPALLAAVFAASALFAHGGKGTPRFLYRADFSAWDYGKALHSVMEPGALLLDPDDPTAFTLGYMTHAHGMRPDIIPLMYLRTWWGYAQLKRRHPELLPDWEIRSGQQLLGTLVSRSLAAGRDMYIDLPQKTPRGAFSFPVGLAYKVLRKPPGIDEKLAFFLRAEHARELLRFRGVPPGAGFFTRHTIEYWSSALNNLAIEASGAGRPEKAVTLYRRAISVTPRLAESWNNLGNVLLSMKKFEAAEGCYLLSARYKPEPSVIYNLGRVYLLSARYPEAESTMRRAIAAGGPREARNDLGLVYLRTDRGEMGVRIWKALLDEDPYYLLAYYNIALAYEKLGKRDEAYAALAAYAQLVQDPGERADARAWMERLKK